MRKNSIKNTRINMEVQRELSEIIRGGIKDPSDVFIKFGKEEGSEDSPHDQRDCR